MPTVIDDANEQISDKALMELKLRLDPFFKGRQARAGAAGAAGDYVWLQDAVFDGGEFEFTAIPQTYRHLAVWASLVSTAADSVLRLRFPPSSEFQSSDEIYDENTAGPSTHAHAGSRIELVNIMPVEGLLDTSDVTCMLTANLPYYALEDRAKAILWQATTMFLTGGGDDSSPVTATGGGQRAYDPNQGTNLPVTAMLFDLDTGDFGALSVASLYGIGPVA